jgi:hypothetical protein
MESVRGQVAEEDTATWVDGTGYSRERHIEEFPKITTMNKK